jgi:mRNA turnover protein 4
VFTVALTKTEKRSTRRHKSAFIQQVRDAVELHESLYVFRFENMRSTKFKDVRLHFRGNNESSRIFLGKNKLLQIALGRSPEEEYADNLRHVSKLMKGGSVGLLFTDQPREQVEEYFSTVCVEPDYARAGTTAPRNVVVTADQLRAFPVSMMEQFRKSGMPVKIQTGQIVFQDGKESYTICKKDEVLSAEKCKLLCHFGIKLVNFKVTLACRWADGEFETLEQRSG